MPAQSWPARRHLFFPVAPFTPGDGFVRTLDAITSECLDGFLWNLHIVQPGALTSPATPIWCRR